jgi:uncharacterized membrane protein YfhO
MVLIAVYQTHKSQPLAALAALAQETLLGVQEQRELLGALAVAAAAEIQTVLARVRQVLGRRVLLLLVVLAAAVRGGRAVKMELQMAVLAVMLQQMALVAVAAAAVSRAVLAHNQAHTHQSLETRA